MKKLLAASVALVTGVGLALAAGPAFASITNPSVDNATLNGTVTFSDSGATSNGSSCINGTSAKTDFSVYVGTVTTGTATPIWTNTQSGTGAKTSGGFDTTAWPNGTYTLKVVETNRTGTLISCSNNTVTNTRPFSIFNAVTIPPATAQGTVTFTAHDSVSAGSLCVGGTSPHVRFGLAVLGGGEVWSQDVSGTGILTTSPVVTENFANGTYVLTMAETTQSGTIACSNSTTTVIQQYAITNVSSLALNIPASAPQHTNASVSATLTDPNAAPAALAGRTVSFALSGGTTVTGVTDASGIATASLPMAGPPRTATVTASFAGESNHTSSSTPGSISVTKDATSTTLAAPAAVVHGQGTSFTATVAATQGGGTPTGTVQFTVDGTNFGSPVALTGGSATSATTTSLSTANHTIGAMYNGDSNYFASNAANVTQKVDKAATTTTLADDPTSTVAGQAVTFTATVGVVSPGAGAPTGAVQFDVDGNPYGTAVPLTGDHATLTISNLHAGNHTVDATYNSDADFASSSSASLTHGVDRADTSVDLTTSVTTPVSGQPVTYSAHVAPTAPGAGSPSGTVTFSVDGVQLGDPVAVDSSGNATSVVTTLLVHGGDPHHVTADYSGDGDFAGGTDSLDQTVVAAHATLALTTSPNPSVFGQQVTLHAEVAAKAPATGHPTGAVLFIVDGGAIGTYVPLVNGVAEQSISTLVPGDHTVKAQYLSDSEDFVAGADDTATQTVNKAATSTTVDSSSPTSVFGQPVTFTAHVGVVSPGAGAPSGTVTFTDGSTVLGTADVSGATGEQASITVGSLSVATHAITASYSGDDDFLDSAGSTTQVVHRAQTATVVTSSANPSASGQGVKFTATVSPVAPGAGLPTGTVTFTINGAPLGSPVSLVGGVATSASFASLSPGTYAVAATYSGDHNFVTSSGSLDQGNGQNVAEGATNLALVSDGSPASYGSPVTFTATVSAVAPATGHPSGVVQFWEGTTLLGSRSLVAGAANASQAAFVSSTLDAGSHAITATYVGNFNFTPASASMTQNVGAVPTVTGLTSNANPITFGDSVTLTASVAAALPAAGTASGTVTFTEGTSVLGTATLTAGSGSLTVSGLTPGQHVIKATYGGDISFGSSASSLVTETVNRAASSMVVRPFSYSPGQLSDYRLGQLSATLTGLGGQPLAGRTISFSTYDHVDHATVPLCSAVTDATGTATCTTHTQVELQVFTDPGYDAVFAGDDDYLPVTGHGDNG